MSLPLILLICLSVFHLCLGTQPEKRLFKEQPWSKKYPESEDVQMAIEYVVEKLNKKSKGKHLIKLVSIHSAKSQGSSKIKYKIDAVFEKTKCPKWKNSAEKSCILDKKKLLCQLVVTLNPRNSKYALKSKKCHIVKNET